MKQDRDWLLAEKYQGQKTEAYMADLGRLENGEPLAYLIGHIPFLDTTIYLDSRPLIPRPETEFWVYEFIKKLKSDQDSQPLRLLDLCAGSGCIGAAVLKAITNVTVDFVEIDRQHHTTILKNLEHNNIDLARANIYDGDLFTQVTETFDYILSNPPYLDPSLNQIEPSVLDYEPSLALYGGIAGFEFITTIISDCPHHLTQNGELWLEHEPEQTPLIKAMAKNLNLDATTYPDQFKINRYTVLTRNN